MIRLHSVILIALAALAAPAAAQVSLQGAHDQGIGFATEQKNSVGTSRINEQTAAQVPLYKPNAVQSGSYDGGFGDMMSIGVGRINQSKTYAPGSCDREGFNPEQAAKSVVGDAKWASMSTAQRQRAIEDQVTFFDQECEGINFLAGEYQMRQKVEIQPSDDLTKWNPGGSPSGDGQCSMQTIYVPAEYEKNSCYQTTALEQRQCFDNANVNVWFEDVLSEKPVPYTFRMAYDRPSWGITVHAAKGTVDVYAPASHTYIRVPCEDGDPRWMCWSGTKQKKIYNETIPLRNGQQTTLMQYGENEDEYHLRVTQRSKCVWAIDNWHYAGGGASEGGPHSHETWAYNFCEPLKHVDVTWQDNCAILESATDLPN